MILSAFIPKLPQAQATVFEIPTKFPLVSLFIERFTRTMVQRRPNYVFTVITDDGFIIQLDTLSILGFEFWWHSRAKGQEKS